MSTRATAGEQTLVSMKLPAEKKGAEKMYPSMESPEYPYGLRIRLEDKQLEQLGVASLPSVGAKLTITAEVEVCCVSSMESAEGGEHRSLELQITALALK